MESHTYSRPPQSNGHPPNHLRPHGPLDPRMAPGPLRPSGRTPQDELAAKLAERFEDEKLRIQASCFKRKTPTGQAERSYITHLRVEEDGAHPSHPPPENAEPAFKKDRVIILGVKFDGTVECYKARENEDRGFQIGKTWDMADVAEIETFSFDVPRSQEDRRRAGTAGLTGFIVHIGKPYFWKGQTQQETDFFLMSLIRIYRKYTDGRLPKLVGFIQERLQAILGLDASTRGPPPATHTQPVRDARLSPPPQLDTRPSAPRRPSEAPPSASGRSPSAASSARQRPPSPNHHLNNNATSFDRNRAVPPSQVRHEQSPHPPPQGRNVAPQMRQRPSQDASVHPSKSREQLQPNRFHSPPNGTPPNLTPKSSRSNFTSPVPFADDRSGTRSPPVRPSDPGRTRPDHSTSSDFGSPPMPAPLSPNERSPLSASTTTRWKPPSTATRSPQEQQGIADVLSSPKQRVREPAQTLPNGDVHALPERRRPPLEETSTSSSSVRAMTEADQIPKPLGTKSKRKEDQRPQQPQQPELPRETPSQVDLRIPGAFASPSPSPAPSTKEGTTQLPSQEAPPSAEPNNVALGSQARSQSPNAKRTETPIKELQSPDSQGDKSPGQQYRPGLGPMTVKKGSSDNVNKWRKAANAATAFKPRAGGAGARLLAEKKQDPSGPDGVTSVVPAPSAARNLSGDKIPPIQPEMNAQDQPRVSAAKEEPPALTVSSSTPQDSPIVQEPRASAAAPRRPSPAREPSSDARSQSSVSRPTLPVEVQPKKQGSEQIHKYLSALNVDPNTLDNRGADYEAVLSDFGWSQNVLQLRTVDHLESALHKEVGRLEAGSWLGHSEHKDQRVEDFERMLDKAISECDEMEGLLTLYSVELSVGAKQLCRIEHRLTLDRHSTTTLLILKHSHKASKCKRRIRNSSAARCRMWSTQGSTCLQGTDSILEAWSRWMAGIGCSVRV